VYGEVPPLNEVVVESIAAWPGLTVEGVTLMMGDVRGGLTLTVATLEITVTLELELSLTSNSNDQVPIVVRDPVEIYSGDSQVDELANLL